MVDERGSALVIAMLITVILALLAISFLMLAETENRIAQNEKRAAQTLYVGEAGLEVVKRWFDYTDGTMHFPDPSVVDRTLRRIIDESDPYDPNDAVDADGIIGSYPYYKQGVDLDAGGVDDLFERPYRGDLLHGLLGTEDGPDMRIDDEDANGATFLADLTETLLAGFPGEAGAVRARISRIDIYAPPYTPIAGFWRRYGLGTVKITVRIYRDETGDREVLGEKIVKSVLSETPYRAPHAPLHSCAGTSFVPRAGGPMTVHWGAISSVGSVKLTDVAGDFSDTPMSLPRDLPFEPGADQLWPTATADFDVFAASIDTKLVDDPWFRVLSAGPILVGAPLGSQQPYPPLDPSSDQDHSNLIHELPLVVCPVYDYRLWKGIALSGARDVHYYAYDAGTSEFKEHGKGTAFDFKTITHGQEGLYFFDTRDGLPPTDDDADGLFDNLTPGITVSGNWDFTGFVYLNALSLTPDGLTGPLRQVSPPGEPFLDGDIDGEYDTGERFINLIYPSIATEIDDEVFADTSAGGASRDARGPAIPDVAVSFRGILYTSGTFEATGTGTFYGSVIALQGVTQTPDDGSADTPTIIWDESIVTEWPPAGWDVPRVVITEWDVGG